MRHKARTDTNHAHIRDSLRQMGFAVADTSRLGDGFPDLVVSGYDVESGRDINLLVELKSGNGKLTPAEAAFLHDWPGPAVVAYCVEDVLQAFGRAA